MASSLQIKVGNDSIYLTLLNTNKKYCVNGIDLKAPSILFKHILSQKLQIDPSNFYLFFENKLLDDDKSLEEQCVKNNDIITLLNEQQKETKLFQLETKEYAIVLKIENIPHEVIKVFGCQDQIKDLKILQECCLFYDQKIITDDNLLLYNLFKDSDDKVIIVREKMQYQSKCSLNKPDLFKLNLQ